MKKLLRNIHHLTGALLAGTLSFCTVLHGSHPETGNYTYASVGGNVEGLSINPGGAVAQKINNSDGLGAVKDLGTNYIIGETTKFALDHTMPGGAPAIIDSVKAP